MGFFAIAALIVMLALQVAWIARSAQRRGRSVLGWVVLGLAAGGVGLAAGRALLRYATGGDDPNNAAIVVGLLAVPISVLVPLTTTALVVARLPFRVGRSRAWQVHVMNRGPGSIHIDGGSIHLAWPEVSRVLPASELRTADVDGECVRFETVNSETLVLLPRGDDRDSRIAQSKALAGALAALRTRERS